jgi:hypothetical protein
MPGIKSLSNFTCPNDRCPISLMSLKSGGSESIIQMYDGQCYKTKYIYKYIVNLIRNGLNLDTRDDRGESNFRLPKKTPITPADLRLLCLDPSNFAGMIAEWQASPEYAAEQAERAEEALRQAEALQEADNMYIPVIEDGNGNHVVETLLRWGVTISRDGYMEYPIGFINNVDHFLLPPGYDNRFDHNDDANFSRRIRNIGHEELQHIGEGYHAPEGPLQIRTDEGNTYNSLQEYADGEHVDIEAIRGNVGFLRYRPDHREGGRRTKRTKRKRTRRRY